MPRHGISMPEIRWAGEVFALTVKMTNKQIDKPSQFN